MKIIIKIDDDKIPDAISLDYDSIKYRINNALYQLAAIPLNAIDIEIEQ